MKEYVWQHRAWLGLMVILALQVPLALSWWCLTRERGDWLWRSGTSYLPVDWQPIFFPEDSRATWDAGCIRDCEKTGKRLGPPTPSVLSAGPGRNTPAIPPYSYTNQLDLLLLTTLGRNR